MKNRLISMLRWSERYTKTDMVYLASGSFWANLNMSVVTILSFVTSILFARYLTKDAFGIYQYVLSIASLIGATTLTGMNSAVTRAVARGFEGEFRRSVRYQIMVGIIPAVLGLSIALWYYLHDNNNFALIFVCVAIFLPMSSALNTWAAYMGGRKLFRISTYFGLTNNIISYGGVMLTLIFAKDYLWVAFANFFFGFLGNFIIYHTIVRKMPPNENRDNETISYGSHLSFMGVFGVFAGQLDSLLVWHFVGASALAVYSFATLIPEKIAGIMKFLPNLALPKLSERTEDEVNSLLKRKLWIVLTACAVMAICYSLLAPFIFHTFFPAYSDSILYSQVYSLSFFSLAATVVNMALTSQRKIKKLYIFNTSIPVVRIVLMAVLMYFYGVWGLLWAQIIQNFVSLGLQLALMTRKPTATI